MLLDISLVLKWWWEQCERLYERQRSVLKTSHLLTLATFLQLWLSSQPPAAPSTSLLSGSHLACHSGTLLPSPFSCWKRASNPHQEEKVQRTTALRVLCEPPATLPLSLSNCFSSFPTFLPRMFICHFFGLHSSTHFGQLHPYSQGLNRTTSRWHSPWMLAAIHSSPTLANRLLWAYNLAALAALMT